MFDKFLYNLGKKLLAKYNPEKHSASSKCPSCNVWSRDLDTPYLFLHNIMEEISYGGKKEARPSGEVYQCCSQCGSVSHWHYGIAPVAICFGFTAPLSVFSKSVPYSTGEQIQDRESSLTASTKSDKTILHSLPEEVLDLLRDVNKNELGKSPRNKL